MIEIEQDANKIIFLKGKLVMKRVIVMILILVMVIGAVGCSNNDENVDNKVTDGVDDGKGENDDGEKNTDLGGNNSQNTDSVLEDYRRYIETDIELPAVVADGSDIILPCLTAGKDGELVIYTAERMKAKEDGENYEEIKN